MVDTCSVCDGFGTVGRRAVQCHACTGLGFIEPIRGQSKRMSLAEICFSTAIGFVVAYAANAVVMPAFGHHVSMAENFWITSIFTVISIARGYCVRRLFERFRR